MALRRRHSSLQAPRRDLLRKHARIHSCPHRTSIRAPWRPEQRSWRLLPRRRAVHLHILALFPLHSWNTPRSQEWLRDWNSRASWSQHILHPVDSEPTGIASSEPQGHLDRYPDGWGRRRIQHRSVFLYVFKLLLANIQYILGMPLDKLTGGKMIATNHRVNTLKVDAERLVLANGCPGWWSQDFLFSDTHLAMPGRPNSISPSFLSLSSYLLNLQRCTPPLTLRWRGSWRSRILSREAVTPECYSSLLRPRNCTQKSTRKPGRWVSFKNPAYLYQGMFRHHIRLWKLCKLAVDCHTLSTAYEIFL